MVLDIRFPSWEGQGRLGFFLASTCQQPATVLDVIKDAACECTHSRDAPPAAVAGRANARIRVTGHP
jgi:hypothetical protein